MPDEGILSLPKLRKVHIISVHPVRDVIGMKCLLSKSLGGNHSALHYISPNESSELPLYHTCVSVQPVLPSIFWNITTTNAFNVYCKRSNYKRPHPNINNKGWYYIKVNNKRCWKTVNYVYIGTVMLGIVTFVFNLVIIAVTLRSSTLLESSAHVLVANLALGDLLISLYIIILTSTRQSLSFFDYINHVQETFCSVVGALFLIGQSTVPLMTFMVTLERYLVIVHCMNTDVRVTLKHVYVTMAIAWSVAIVLAICFMVSPDFAKSTDSICIPYHDNQVLIYLAFFLGILYFISIIPTAVFI